MYYIVNISISVLMKADMKCDEPRDKFEPGNDRLGVEELFKGIHPALVKLAEWNREITAFATLKLP